MSIRIIGRDGNILGTLQLPVTALMADLEPLRRLGAYRIEVIANA